MPPAIRLAFTVAGREGSLSVTAMRSLLLLLFDDCAWVRAGTANMAALSIADPRKTKRKLRVGLFMVFENTDVSIQIFDFDFWATRIDAGSGKTIGAENCFCATMVFDQRVRR